ncbi:hypothetical protein [Desulfonatronospira sp.]|uniref:hypothetical protein n=1 Tax=Desulfonatronospira sp. TaxID=1962951 RepID=UPI0025C552CC|nr:hypothetical protein [Desulfonatronospira sp.]
MVNCKTETIMVLEHDHHRALDIADNLKSWGMTPLVCDSHFKALEKTEEQHFSVILACMEDTGIDGLEFCRILKNRQQLGRMGFTFIILMGENHHRIDICESREGVDDFIIHPFLDCELKWRIMSGLARQREYHESLTSSLFDPATLVLNEKGLKKVLYQEVNRLGRKQGFLSLAVLDFRERDMMELSLGTGLCRWAKEEVLKSMKDRLRNYDQLARTDLDRICIISGENSIEGITGLLNRISGFMTNLDFKAAVVNDFDLSLGGAYVSLQVKSTYDNMGVCAEHMYDWISEIIDFSGSSRGYTGHLDESGLHIQSVSS